MLATMVKRKSWLNKNTAFAGSTTSVGTGKGVGQLVVINISNPAAMSQITAVVKGGVKLDHRGGGKVDQFTGSWGLDLKDLRGRLERRPATRFAGRV